MQETVDVVPFVSFVRGELSLTAVPQSFLSVGKRKNMSLVPKRS